MKKLKKAACFTDIHWGARNNSELHNQDCIRFILWFCEQVKLDPDVDHIIFLGDWFENRSAIDVDTLNYAHRGASLLNELGLPIYFIVGNHDLYRRHERDVHSVKPYHDLHNFIVVDTPTVFDEIGSGTLISPYLFEREYPNLNEYLNLDAWFGHFEFNGFIVTGYTTTMTSGTDPDNFKGPMIFSGHFHKRQINKNIIYIGNTFPTSFADVDDSNRGMMKYVHKTRKYEFTNWEQCPTFQRVNLSNLLEGECEINNGARVDCVVDIPIDFDESIIVKQTMVEKYKLREFNMTESLSVKEALSEADTDDIDDEDEDGNSITTDELVVQLISRIDNEKIDSSYLTEIYSKL